EYEARTPEAARAAGQDLADRLRRGERLAQLALVASTDEELERLGRGREAVLPGLLSLRGSGQPLAFVEDVGVPVEHLPVYLHRVQDVLQRHEVTASFLVHAATGQVHVRPFLDLQRREDTGKLWALADEVYDVVLGLGGTVSAQHGTGLARTPWVSRQYGRLYQVFRELKSIFDPRHLFNPGKIVGPSPGMPAWPLRKTLNPDSPVFRPAPAKADN